MLTISFKHKILLLSLLPVVLSSLLIIGVVAIQTTNMGNTNTDLFSKKFYELRKNELKNYVDIAITSIQHLDKTANQNQSNQKEQAKNILRNLRYDSDGYFFTYEKTTTLAHPNPIYEGKNQENLVDSNGTRLIADLYEQTQNGGGYVDYLWNKPSLDREVTKISYGKPFKELSWWVGTGLYVDDLEQTIVDVEGLIKENIRRILSLIIGFTGLIIIITILIGYRLTLLESKLADKRLHDLTQKVVKSQEEERGKLAKELQKNIGSTLMKAKHSLQQLKKHQSNRGNIDNDSLSLIVSSLDNGITAIHRISGELRPSSLDEIGLFSSLEDVINRTLGPTNIEFKFKKMGDENKLSPEIETAIYRITQSALENIVKHSRAKNANIRLQINRSSINLTIQDNGTGFSLSRKPKSGLGLTNMRIRCEALGGNFNIFSSNNSGVLIRIKIPL